MRTPGNSDDPRDDVPEGEGCEGGAGDHECHHHGEGECHECDGAAGPRLEWYQVMVEGHPLDVAFDATLIELLPVTTHPVAVRVQARFASAPRSEPFTEAEFEVAGEIGELAIDRLCVDQNAVFALRSLYRGVCTYLFYAPATAVAEPLLAECRERWPDLQMEVFSEADAEWSHFLSACPDEEQWRGIWNRNSLEALDAAGSDMAAAHLLLHEFTFPQLRQAETVAERLAREGFECPQPPTAVKSGESTEYQLTLAQLCVPALDTVERITSHLDALAREFNGSYEGWAADVVGDETEGSQDAADD